MKPFDLEAAKRGAPFCKHGYPTRVMHFVGISRVGMVACEVRVNEAVTHHEWCDMSRLCMLPKKVVRYGVIHENRKGTYIASTLAKDPTYFGSIEPGYHLARVEWEE